MKTSIKLIALASLMMAWSCSKTTDDNPDPNSSTNKVEQASGDWIVSYYFDSGKDETSDYNGYTFTFSTDGTIQARSGSVTFTGTWRIGDHSSDDDNSSNRFVITITGNKQMDDLTDDWVILGLSSSGISLQDDNPSSMEELRFSRKNQ